MFPLIHSPVSIMYIICKKNFILGKISVKNADTDIPTRPIHSNNSRYTLVIPVYIREISLSVFSWLINPADKPLYTTPNFFNDVNYMEHIPEG